MIKTSLPVFTLNNIILFPHSEVRLEVENDKDKELISLAENYYNKHILIVHDPSDISSNYKQNIEVGIIGYISMKIDLPNNKTRIVVRGLNRVKIANLENDYDNFTISEVEPIKLDELDELEEMAYKRSLLKQAQYFIENVPNMSNSVLSQILEIRDLDKLTDILAASFPINYERKLEYVFEVNPTIRVVMLLDDISRELRVIELENNLDEKINHNIEQAQKEYILQEKIKVIKEELGAKFDKDIEIEDLTNQINNLNATSTIKERLLFELNRYEATPSSSPEIAIIRSYIDWLLGIPWEYKTIDNKDLTKANEALNDTHFGLTDVKTRILEYLALLQRTNFKNSPILCLVGPPGVGKTSLAKSIAKAMNRNYTKISVGGVNDESEIVGHRRAYIGSAPGKIITGMKKAGSINPVFVIDEIDKMTKDIKGDPASSLLEILDKEQNKNFCDNYIEEEYDLSNVMFICTANYEQQIPLELYDRLEIIQISSYTEFEKLNICKNHILPKSLKEHELDFNLITFSDDAILKIIRGYTKEAGVRELERIIARILRKIVKELVISNQEKTYHFDDKEIEKYLGKEKYSYQTNEKDSVIGVINAMSYTIFGGDILKIEASYYKGNGNIILTGSLGEVFIESAKIALSYIKSNYKEIGIDYNLLTENDIHIHVPEGAVKKDGPSAGIALASVIISAFTNKKVSTNISMTGELTLRGNVLPIGGLKEKVIGAKRSKVKKIIIPFENKKDLEEMEDYIKEDIEFILVKNYKEVLENIF